VTPNLKNKNYAKVSKFSSIKKKKKKNLKQAKGYFGRRKNVWTVAKNAVEKGVNICIQR
jgi:ribosomal protein L20